MQHNLYEYIAKANPKGANRIINEYGYQGGRNTEEITRFLSEIALREKETFLKDLMKVHPDKPLIDEFTDEFNSPRRMSNDYMNGDGDSGCSCNEKAKRSDYGYDFYQGAKYRGADADEVMQSTKRDFSISTQSILFFAIGVLAGAVFFGKKSA